MQLACRHLPHEQGVRNPVLNRSGMQDYRRLAAILFIVIIWLIVLTVPVAIQKSKPPGRNPADPRRLLRLIAGLAVSTFLIAPKLKKTGKK